MIGTKKSWIRGLGLSLLAIVLCSADGCFSSKDEDFGNKGVDDGCGYWASFVLENNSDHDILIQYYSPGSTSLPLCGEITTDTNWREEGLHYKDYGSCAISIPRGGGYKVSYSYFNVCGLKNLDASPCNNFNYPFMRSKPEDDGLVADSLRIYFNKGTAEERYITYTARGLKPRDLRRNETWEQVYKRTKEEAYKDWPSYFYTFVNEDYERAAEINAATPVPIPEGTCLAPTNY